MNHAERRQDDANWELLRLAVLQHGKSRNPVRVKERSRSKTRAFDDPTADLAIDRADKALARKKAA